MPRPPPRYAPAVALPKHPFRPGEGMARPRLPLAESAPGATPLATTADLSPADVLAFRYGVDLYNGGFCWEAHEVWEGLWRRARRGSALAALLQGLILLAAARLKAQQPRGQRRLAQRAVERLRGAHEREPAARPLGLPLAKLLADAEAWSETLQSAPPALRLR